MCALALAGVVLSARDAAAAAPAQLVSTTITLASSQNPTLTTGTPSITATVTSSTGATPDGSVQFTLTRPDGSTISTSQSLSTSNSVSISLPESPLQAGTYTVAAQYIAGPSDVFASSTTTFYDLADDPTAIATNTHLVASPSVVTAAQTISFTATVSRVDTGTSIPTGTVSFVENGTIIGTATLAAGQATFTSSTLGVGVHHVSALYGGDAAFGRSVATTIAVVNSAGSFLSSSQNPTLTSGTPTITATIPSGATAPTGSVQFSVTRPDGSTINTLQFLSTSNGRASSMPERQLQDGTYTIARSEERRAGEQCG